MYTINTLDKIANQISAAGQKVDAARSQIKTMKGYLDYAGIEDATLNKMIADLEDGLTFFDTQI